MQKQLWPIVFVLGGLACGAPKTPAPASPPPAPAAAGTAHAERAPERAAKLDAALGTLAKVDTHREDGVRHTSLSGYFRDGQLVVLEETVTGGTAPALHNRYYYEHGLLFYFSGEMPAGAIGGGPNALGATVPAHAQFEGARTLAAVRNEHYGEVRLDEAAVGAIRRQGAELASAVTSEEQAPKRP